MSRFLKQFSWRFLLVRILVNAIALAVTAAILPKVYFVNKSIWNLLFMAVTLGILNALVKPILQALTLHFIVATYGLVIVLVNAVMLLLLSLLFPERFAVDSLLGALVGGLVLGLLSSFLESLLGLTMPIVSDEPPELRRQLEEQARHIGLSVGKDEQAPSAVRGPHTKTLATEMIQIAPGPPTTAETTTTASGSIERPSSGQDQQAPAEQDNATLSDPASTSPGNPDRGPASESQGPKEDQA
jgi:putative membrane protein